MDLQSVKVSVCYESETNPRGSEFEGKQFDELVASVKEKGVLVPILVRPRPKNGKEFEVVAGNRRFRAAQKAGLAEIPTQVKQMSDDEAREAQIVENLQRADVHPLEEGEAYRKLIEDGGRKVADVAVKVGKPESYVRQRLFLTNLSPKMAKVYREGDIPDSNAVLVARLSAKDQDELLATRDYLLHRQNRDLKDWIKEHVYKPLAFQPWVNNAEVATIVGPCKECPPKREALFGDVKAGTCTDLRCWQRKMDTLLTHRIKEENLVPVVKQYGEPDRKTFAGKQVLSESQYKGLPTQKKKHCDFAQQSIVVDGPDTGSTLWICADAKCDKHREEFRDYAPSEKEKAKRKAERKRQIAARAKFDAEILKGLEKVKWPLSEKHLDVLLDLVFRSHSTSYQMPIVKRHGLEPIKKKGNYGVERDYATPLRKLAKDGGKDAKLRLVFEFLVPGWSPYGTNPNKEVKSL